MKATHLTPLLFMTTAIQAQPLRTVPHVDIERYTGKWYEIASYPQGFQKGCHGTTVTYTQSDQGYLAVENRCNRDRMDGKTSYIKGKTLVEEGTGNAQLKVQSLWPFSGKYYIIDLASDYSYAVVGHPNRKYLWILLHSPRLARGV